MAVALLPPSLKGSRFLTVREVSGNGPSSLASFSSIDSIAAAEELVGRSILARLDDLPANVELLDRESLIGCLVVDRALGTLGTLVEILAGPAQDVYRIEGTDGELLVPVVPEFVIGLEGSTLMLQLPDGTVLSGEG